jgi:hemolysin activation/secretion protein
MLKPTLLIAALVSAGQTAQAQQAVGAGGQLQQIPPAALQARPTPDFALKPNAPAPIVTPAGPKLRVKSLHLTGQALFPEAVLIGATSFTPNSEFDLAGLQALAAQVTAFYNRHGYFLAQAYVPEQNIQGDSVTIAIVEGRFGKVGIDNRSALSDRVANNILAGIKADDVVATDPLERRLLLLSDIPGVLVRSTLSPGTMVGTSDLVVALEPARRVSGTIEADNAGNRYTGAIRAGGTININDPTGSGDMLSFRVLTSFTGLAYGRAAYQALAGNATLGIAYAHIRYSLGKEFESLNATGNGDVASVYGSYPLIRSHDSNLYLQASGDAKWFQDRLGFISANSHRRTQVATIGLTGDEHDRVGGGGWSAYSASISVGNLDLHSPADVAADALGAQSNGSYGKAQGSIARLQTVAGPFSLYGSIRGQIAFDNLDISEKMELGGAYGVRAYPEGEAYGDQGYVATAEARLLLRDLVPVPGDFQLFALIDTGEVDYNKDPWTIGSNHARRSGFGGGVSWAAPAGFVLKGTYARKIGETRATSAPDRAGRGWFQVSKVF